MSGHNETSTARWVHRKVTRTYCFYETTLKGCVVGDRCRFQHASSPPSTSVQKPRDTVVDVESDLKIRKSPGTISNPCARMPVCVCVCVQNLGYVCRFLQVERFTSLMCRFARQIRTGVWYNCDSRHVVQHVHECIKCKNVRRLQMHTQRYQTTSHM
jgi:hypothetical protein